MIYLRIFTSCLFLLGGFWSIYGDLHLAYTSSYPDFFDAYGIVNVSAGCAVFLIGLYILLYTLKEIFNVKLPFLDRQKSIIFFIVLGIFIGIGISKTIDSNIEQQGYIQCSDLTKIATRYTRKTYTKTPEICEQLIADKSQ